ncbi:MAG: hypothetical protein KDD35_06195 [Bdellovibrionales bacterium]|nr:hypothetical protein [Bdellovibrionales bacterium]
MRYFKSCLVCFCFLSSISLQLDGVAFAQSSEETEEKTEVKMEWEPMPEAKAYELEFQPSEGSGEALLFTTTETKFKSQFIPGVYRFRIRSIDKDSVKGSWSSPLNVVARPQQVVLKFPIGGEIVESESKRQDIAFAWETFPEAKGYVFLIWSETSGAPRTFKTRKTEVSLRLLSGRKYFWEVYSVDMTGIRYQSKRPPETFVLYGERVPKPEIEIVSNRYPQVAKWKVAKGAIYKMTLYRRDLLGEEWKIVKTEDGLKDGSWTSTEPLQAGEYRIELEGRALKRISSELGQKEFLVKPTLKELSSVSAQSCRRYWS